MAEKPDEEEQIASVIAGVSLDQWQQLRELADQLISRSEAAGEWTPAVEGDDGVWSWGGFRWSNTLEELVQQLYAADLITDVFDWPEWWSNARYHDGAHVDEASLTDLVRIVTSVVRGDRFSEGTIAKYVSNGTVPTAVQRPRSRVQQRAGPQYLTIASGQWRIRA